MFDIPHLEYSVRILECMALHFERLSEIAFFYGTDLVHEQTYRLPGLRSNPEFCSHFVLFSLFI